MSYYPFGRKTMKWWKKAFFHIYMMGLFNCYRMHCMKTTNKSISFCDYLKALAKSYVELAGENIERQPNTPAPPRSREGTQYQPGRHFPERIPPTEKKAKPTRACAHCPPKINANGKRTKCESSWQCFECKVTLCIECFHPYHNRSYQNNRD